MSGHVNEKAYRRISEEIEDAIRSGAFTYVHRLPGEYGLAERFDVSRSTVRQALAFLARTRLIATRPGSGSYITFDHQQLGWSKALAQHGAQVESRIIRFGAV